MNVADHAKNNKLNERSFHRLRSKSIVFNNHDFIVPKFTHNKSNKNNNIRPSIDLDTHSSKYNGLLNEMEIMKINENIHNDIHFIQLRKKTLLKQLLKRHIQSTNKH